MIGDFSGMCYLIFYEDMIDKLLKISLPNAVFEDSGKCKDIVDTILTNMDDIISPLLICRKVEAYINSDS